MIFKKYLKNDLYLIFYKNMILHKLDLTGA